MNNEHPQDALLVRFVHDDLPAAEREALLAHLADCDQCLQRVDELWTATLALDVPEGGDNAAQLEHQLLKRIRRSDFIGDIARLGTEGMAQSLLAMVRPLLDWNQTEQSEQPR